MTVCSQSLQIVGPKDTSVPQAGLDTEARAGPLAQLIAKEAVSGKDPNGWLLYNSINWAFANNTIMPAGYDWLATPVNKTINGRKDAFSQRLGQECQPFSLDPPEEALFDPKNVAVLGNGRCASSCSLFSVSPRGLSCRRRGTDCCAAVDYDGEGGGCEDRRLRW